MTLSLTGRPRKYVLLAGFFFVFFSLSVRCSFGQEVHLSGRVKAVGTNEEIAGASLALLGTGHGAKANRDGNYRLTLESGKAYRIRITAIGYKPDTMSITLTQDAVRDVLLTSAPIGGAAITVAADASRREAHRIIQRVIDQKDAWQSEINSYQFQVYSRLNVRTRKDTSSKVIAVLESVADGFWKRDKGYAEKIVARKETANLPAEANRVALFDIDNFYNERIEVEDYNVIGPVAHDAFDRYDYDLVGQGELNGAQVYKISVEPLNALYPAFKGTLWIDQADYTIAYLDLSPNEAIKIGPIKDIHLQQTFSVVQNKYWMPSQLAFSGTLKLDVPIIPAFHIEQNAVLQSYAINPALSDTLFEKHRHDVAPTADSVDSVSWLAMRAIPLAADERSAYHQFDSLAKVPPAPHEFSPIDLLFWAVGMPDVYSFDRVEGSRFQATLGIDHIDSWPFTAQGMLAYGLRDKVWKYSVDAQFPLTWETRTRGSASISSNGDVEFGAAHDVSTIQSSIRAHVYDDYLRRGEAYSRMINTLTTLLLHNDYPDYYHARGAEASFDHAFQKTGGHLEFGVKVEDDNSLTKLMNHGLINVQDTFRVNPPVNEGTIREVHIGAHGSNPLGNWTLGTQVSVALGDQSFRAGRPLYLTEVVEVSLDGKAGGWGKTHIVANISDVLTGALGHQQLFYFESRNTVLGPRDVFHTMYPLEFQGDKTWSIMYEQNTYDLPMRLLGVTLPIDLQWIGFLNIAGAKLTDASNALQPIPVKTIGSTPFVEVGLGIGNIFNVLRFDAAWRITHRVENNFFVTGTLSLSF